MKRQKELLDANDFQGHEEESAMEFETLKLGIDDDTNCVNG